MSKTTSSTTTKQNNIFANQYNYNNTIIAKPSGKIQYDADDHNGDWNAASTNKSHHHYQQQKQQDNNDNGFNTIYQCLVAYKDKFGNLENFDVVLMNELYRKYKSGLLSNQQIIKLKLIGCNFIAFALQQPQHRQQHQQQRQLPTGTGKTDGATPTIVNSPNCSSINSILNKSTIPINNLPSNGCNFAAPPPPLPTGTRGRNKLNSESSTNQDRTPHFNPVATRTTNAAASQDDDDDEEDIRMEAGAVVSLLSLGGSSFLPPKQDPPKQQEQEQAPQQAQPTLQPEKEHTSSPVCVIDSTTTKQQDVDKSDNDKDKSRSSSTSAASSPSLSSNNQAVPPVSKDNKVVQEDSKVLKEDKDEDEEDMPQLLDLVWNPRICKWVGGNKKQQEAWEQMYNNLLEYKKKHGHVDVSQQKGENGGYAKLGRWVSYQRYIKKKGLLSQYRDYKLNKINFIWSKEVAPTSVVEGGNTGGSNKKLKLTPSTTTVTTTTANTAPSGSSIGSRGNKRGGGGDSCGDDNDATVSLDSNNYNSVQQSSYERYYKRTIGGRILSGSIHNNKIYQQQPSRREEQQQHYLRQHQQDVIVAAINQQEQKRIQQQQQEEEQLLLLEKEHEYREHARMKIQQLQQEHQQAEEEEEEEEEGQEQQDQTTLQVNAKRKKKRSFEEATAAATYPKIRRYINNEKHQQVWDRMFHRLVDYKEKFGNCNVPRGYKDDVQLGRWVNKQRSDYNSNNLPEDRFMKLKSVSFTFRVNVSWEDMYKRLVWYKQKYGHTNVPRSYTEEEKEEDDDNSNSNNNNDNNINLGEWVYKQRYCYSKNSGKSVLSLERQRKLNDLGFVWELDNLNIDDDHNDYTASGVVVENDNNNDIKNDDDLGGVVRTYGGNNYVHRNSAATSTAVSPPSPSPPVCIDNTNIETLYRIDQLQQQFQLEKQHIINQQQQLEQQQYELMMKEHHLQNVIVRHHNNNQGQQRQYQQQSLTTRGGGGSTNYHYGKMPIVKRRYGIYENIWERHALGA